MYRSLVVASAVLLLNATIPVLAAGMDTQSKRHLAQLGKERGAVCRLNNDHRGRRPARPANETTSSDRPEAAGRRTVNGNHK